MSSGPSPPHVVRFGVFEVNLAAQEVRKHGVRLRLSGHPFEVLTLLLEKPGEVVTRERVREQLWPADTFVDFEHGLNAAVKRLRRVLGDSPENPRYVETLPRVGYRFIAPVEVRTTNNVNGAQEREGVFDATTENAHEPGMPSEIGSPARAGFAGWGVGARRLGSEEETKIFRLARNYRSIALFAVLAALLVAAVAAIRILRTKNPQPPAPGMVHSLAVLPLKNLSNDPAQSYFTDGMTDELITRLAALEGLRVISRTSVMRYKDTSKSLPEIASDLHVDAIVEGTVLYSGDRVRISAQLVHGANDQHLWAESYERDTRDVLDLQNEVARDIARQISLKLSPAAQTRLATSRAVDPEVLQLYLRGRSHWHTRRTDDLHQAIAEFQQAISRDPNFAPGYAGLADCYVVLPFLSSDSQAELYPKAKQAAAKALALDPTLAEVHNSIAYARMYHDWDFVGAEQEFKEAIHLNPNYSTAHQWYAEMLSLEARFQEAFAEIEKAEELDPFAAIVYHQAGTVYYDARQYDRAMEEYKKSLALDPHLAYNYWGLAGVYWQQGMYREFVEATRTAVRGMSEKHTAELVKLTSEAEFCQNGDINGCIKKLMDIARLRNSRPSYFLARGYVMLGNDAKAFEYAERAYSGRDNELLRINIDPEWDRLRSDPRFVALLKKIDLPRATLEQTSSGR